MLHADHHRETLAILVSRLVTFLEERQRLHNLPLANAPPPGLEHVIPLWGHHLVVLMLVARSDERVLQAERDVILRHCLNQAKAAGAELTATERDTLEEYLRHFRPTAFELTPAVEKLKQASHEELAGLIATAHELVEADGEVRLQEVLFLRTLVEDLASVMPGPVATA